MPILHVSRADGWWTTGMRIGDSYAYSHRRLCVTRTDLPGERYRRRISPDAGSGEGAERARQLSRENPADPGARADRGVATGIERRVPAFAAARADPPVRRAQRAGSG